MKVYAVMQDDEGEVTLGPIFTTRDAAKAWCESGAKAAFETDLRNIEWKTEEGDLYLYDTDRFCWYWSVQERDLT